ncbi:MAG: GH92 family glycosyl hydrolase [Bacteroidia bacterium]|nr:GH92 family glycosyl hydrolase [Bacteroidia bacterium]
MTRFILFIILLCCVYQALPQNQQVNPTDINHAFNPVQYVDPMIGTGGHGHTYPGASMPFGMVQLSPDTRLDGWDGCSGYHYSDSIIYGFSHTHLSGTGCSDYGDILLMPVSGKVELDHYKYASHFSHKNEKASAGYYSVYLDKPEVKAELTAGKRAGFHRYSFNNEKKANLVIDLKHRDQVIDSWIEVVSNTEIQGMRRSKGWADDQVLYFYAVFSKAFDSYAIAKDDIFQKNIKRAEGTDIKAYVSYKNTGGQPVMVKVGISSVSCESAFQNVFKEFTGWDFDLAVANAEKEWNKELGKIQVEGGNPDQMKTFYTALYHCMLTPNLYSDADGGYRGRDKKIHHATDFDYYTVFSLWDTYRAEHPLFTIIDQNRTNSFIKTFIAQYEQDGLLPVWELSACETNCMIGYHSVSVIADAFVKGIRNYDINKALIAMKNSANQHNSGLDFYHSMGLIPGDMEAESVSKTLEYSYDDWCIAQVSRYLGRVNDYMDFIRRSQFYKNVYDPSSGLMRARWNGAWYSPFDPAEVNNNYTEANAWQYSFYVPQDVSGLIGLMGGKDKFVAKLDEMFTTKTDLTGRQQADISGLIGQYAHGNEPSHHMAYLYDYAGQPWKTQQKVRQIMDEMYSAKPDGLCGNEDCGQMSAWYVMSALGIYSLCPGQLQYAIGSPLFPKVTINLENKKKFIIRAENLSRENFYIQSASLNGKDYTKCYLNHNDIMNGGELIFTMANTPAKQRAVADPDVPQTIITDNLIVPVPVIESSGKTFKNKMNVEIKAVCQGVKLFYSTDGSVPDTSSKKYQLPLEITANTTIKAIAFSPELGYSFPAEAHFFKAPEGRNIQLITAPDPQYASGGADVLIDGILGNTNWRLGGWLGFQGKDVEAIIDLGKKQNISNLSVDLLQDMGAWIMMPPSVDFYASDDGNSYKLVATAKSDVPEKEEKTIAKKLSSKVELNARYIKVKINNFGKLPAWHMSAGNPAWTFIDEISVE